MPCWRFRAISGAASKRTHRGASSISANGVNATKGTLGMQYLVRTVAASVAELRGERGLQAQPDPVVVENRYDPTLEYRNYMIPALMIMLLILLCGFLPALNLVGEKETGTIEQINVTPVSQFAFTLAKLIPYWAIGLGVLTLAMSLAWAVYGLVPVGSLGAVYLAAALFIFVMSGLGVIAANYSATMQQTMFGMFFFVMIFILMSGLLTPVESMPAWAQRITWFLPPRYFIGIMRAVYLKGATVRRSPDRLYAALALFAVLFNLWAALSYRRKTVRESAFPSPDTAGRKMPRADRYARRSGETPRIIAIFAEPGKTVSPV